MSEVLAASGTLGKLNLDGGKRQARADLFGFMQTLLAIDPTVEPAMHARTLDEREGPAAATAAARSDRAAADAADTALCQKLMGHLIVASVGEARTIVTTAMDGREALAALIEFVDGDASTPDGSDAIITDTSEISWNTFPTAWSYPSSPTTSSPAWHTPRARAPPCTRRRRTTRATPSTSPSSGA